MLYDQDAVVVLLQNGHELKGCEGAAHLLGGEVAIKPTEDARGVGGSLGGLDLKLTVR